MTPWNVGFLPAAFLLALLVLATGAAHAQPSDQPGIRGAAAVAPARSDASQLSPAIPLGHGWMTIRDDRDQSTILLHLPPRTAGADEVGSVRIAPGVSGQTDAIAFYGDRVWLALTPESGPSNTILRRIVTLSAEMSMSGAWDYPPGRPEVLPPLPGRDELVGFVGTARGPVALTRSRLGPASGTAPKDWSLHLLAGSSWQSLSLPWSGEGEAAVPGATTQVVGVGNSLGILVFPPKAGAWTFYQAELPATFPAASTGDQALTWTSENWPLAGVNRPAGSAFAPDAVYFVGDGRTQQLVAVSWLTEGAIELVTLRASGAAPLATVPGVPREHRVSPMNSTGSLAILWWEVSGQSVGSRDPVPGSTAARKFTITEISAISGKELYRGEHKGGGLISGGELKLLAIALLLVTALVLLFALRAEPTSKLVLPEGFILADPLRRVIAAGADLVPGVVIAAFSMGLEPETMLSPAIFIGPRAEPFAWLLALGLTILHSTVGEAMVGRSIGKALTGCEVASLRRDKETGVSQLGPLMVWQALVRNVIRWGVPILGILLLIDGSCRHPADAAARTIVVVRLDEPDDE